MVALSGTDIEIVNVIIVALVALGTWLLASALAAVRPRKAPSVTAYDSVDPETETEPAVEAEVTAALADPPLSETEPPASASR